MSRINLAMYRIRKATAIRDLKDLVSKMIIGDISTSNTDPNKRYKLIE